MTTKKRAATGKGEVRKLKLKKETVEDLDVKGKAHGVKGGMAPFTPPVCGGSAGRMTCNARAC